MDKFKHMFQTFPITIHTTWKQVQEMYKSRQAYKEDSRMQQLDMVDVLAVFEDHMKKVEETYHGQFEKIRKEFYRKERKNREAFRALLKQIHGEGSIEKDTPWKVFFQRVKEEPVFISMVGQEGSSPLDLYWDFLVDLEQQYTLDKELIINELKVMFLND
jgi:pre-mRNA-processing factor 40